MIYLQLFLSFLQIGALSFGGGYASMPLIEAQIVTGHGWLTMTEFSDLVTIAEMTPAPLPSMRPPLWARRWRVSWGPWWQRRGASSRPACW